MLDRKMEAMASERLRKEDRVRRRRDYLRIQRYGEKIHLRYFLAMSRMTESGGSDRRIGITVSKKVGCAVERNRVKRLVREVWRKNRTRFPVKRDVVVIAKRCVREAGYAEIERDLQQLGRRLTGRIEGTSKEGRGRGKEVEARGREREDG